MRKWINIVLIGCLLFITGKTFAYQNPDYGYVIVKCTVTLSVDVEDNATAYFNTGDEPDRYVISAGENLEYVSISSITVKNDSLGAICNWKLSVSAIERSANLTSWTTEDRWTLSTDDTPGVHEPVLYAVFASSKPSFSEFGSEDILTTTEQKWTDNTKYDPATGTPFRYAQPTVTNFTDTDKMILPTTGDNRKALWFGFKPPTAVVDEDYRRFTIKIEATLAAN